ncbi:6fb0d92d-b7a4-4a54-9b26-fe0a4a17d8f9 [Sclerotinia trifoliorum]|uniref:6fb0d92d-b7a4-4a54-9b26-fe0a4a17d8f9 n=1 Tax=Sclerotinia trifoliorum TaxID=28548 RepID=A0A8H2VXV0_9HELO|nr:6fb0d92d-b7a4-4a54-9b26-fe0a4a17d8f9 [Sclerotinia trifoliorum]
MTYERQRAIESYGWTAVPASLSQLIQTSSSAQTPAPTLKVTDLPFPTSQIIKTIQEYARQELPAETYNHSMRVYHYGVAILTHAFPSWTPINPSSKFLESYALTALLHDIGTIPKYLQETLMSFDLHGGFIADKVLGDAGVVREQREVVVEGIIRHQDLGEVGTQTRIGALVQLATVFDNMGMNPELVGEGTIENVVKEWPRLGWSKCFSHTIQQENAMKPWAHSTHLGVKDFPNGVLENKLMEKWD